LPILWCGLWSSNSNSIQQTADKGYILTGFTESFVAENKDVYLVKIDSLDEFSNPVGLIDEFESQAFSLYPNPSNGIITFTSSLDNELLEVLNLQGKVVYSELISGGINTINLKHLCKGIYVYQVRQKSKLIYAGKIVLQ
jgi:hypothetical protein